MSLLFWRKEKEILLKPELDEDGFPRISYEHRQKLKERAMLINYPIGSDVIVKSNENEPYHRGRIISYMPITKAEQLTPVVKFNDTNEEFLCLGIIRHYSKELCDALDKLDFIEQWNVLSEFHKINKK